MVLSTGQAVASIAVMAAVTFLTRALPFLLFYCLRTVRFAAVPQWAPQLIAAAAVVALHVWKHNNLLSIFGGTVLYMVLVQAVFV